MFYHDFTELKAVTCPVGQSCGISWLYAPCPRGFTRKGNIYDEE